jgi:hypothetical protein
MTSVARPGLQTPLLKVADSIDAGAGSGSLFLVDVNRDRQLDLIASLRNQHIGVWLGNGTGRFTAWPVGATKLDEQPRALAIGDVNGDGAVDLAIALQNDTSERVAIRLGDGTGRFVSHGLPITIATATQFYKPFLRLADVYEDGALDVIAGNERGASLEVLPGDGRGSFGARLTVSHLPDYDHQASNLADVDGDGHLDLLTALKPGASRQPSRLLIRRGDGQGHFTRRDDPTAVATDHEVATAADLNADGSRDLILMHPEQRLLTVLLNNGRGQFTPTADSPIDLPLSAFAVVVADVNRDAVPDLIATTVDNQSSQGRSELLVLTGIGKGRFARSPAALIPTGPGGYQLASGDINGDGKPDFAVSSFSGPEITVILGQ